MATERITPRPAPDEPRLEALARHEETSLHLELEELEANEPPCECERVDVDYYDAGPCEFHNPRSSWNQRRRAVEAALDNQQHEPAVAVQWSQILTDADAPF